MSSPSPEEQPPPEWVELNFEVQQRFEMNDSEGRMLVLEKGSQVHGKVIIELSRGPVDHGPGTVCWKVLFECFSPIRFVYSGSLRIFDLMFQDGDKTYSREPLPRKKRHTFGALEKLLDDRDTKSILINGKPVDIWVRLMGTTVTAYGQEDKALMHCRFFDVKNLRRDREIWYWRHYEALLFRKVPKYYYDKEGKLVDFSLGAGTYYDFRLLDP